MEHARPAGAAQATLRIELRPLLVQRMRGALWILLVAAALFFLQALPSYPDRLAPLWTIKLIQVVTILWGFWMLRGAPAWERAVAVALVVIAEVCATTAASGAITDDASEAMLLFSILAMGSAMLLPWGVWPQALTVAIAATAVALNLRLVSAPLEAALAPGITAVLAFVTSVYAAAVLDRYRVAESAAREELRASEARKGAVVGASPDSIITIDGAGRIVEFNAAAERTFGYAAADILGRTMSDTIIPPRLRAAHVRGLSRYLAGGEPAVLGRRLETSAVRADGRELPVELTITQIAGGSAPLFTGFLRDLTDRNLAREAHVSAILVRASRTMIGLLDTGLILERLCLLTGELLACDCNHTFLWQPADATFVVRAAQGELSAHVEALRGRSVPRSAMAALLARVQRDELAQVAAGGGLDAGSRPLHDDDGPVLYMALGRGEEMVGIHAAARHRTAEAFTDQEESIARGLAQIASMALINARLVEELARADRVKTEFLSTMSHELRTPLNVVLGYAEMLEDPDAPASERLECVARIRAAGGSLLELVEMTLDVGRAETGQDGVRLMPLRLPGFWRTLGEECVRLPRHPDVRLEWDADVPDVGLLTDLRKFKVVIRNLVGNALKFTEHGCVRAEASCRDGGLAVKISDTGIGIDSEDQEVIFEMFRQLDGSDSRRHGGAGLGLYIVRRYVEQLGGRVDLHSRPGSGSVFTLSLPLPAEPLAAARRAV